VHICFVLQLKFMLFSSSFFSIYIFVITNSKSTFTPSMCTLFLYPSFLHSILCFQCFQCELQKSIHILIFLLYHFSWTRLFQICISYRRLIAKHTYFLSDMCLWLYYLCNWHIVPIFFLGPLYLVLGYTESCWSRVQVSMDLFFLVEKGNVWYYLYFQRH